MSEHTSASPEPNTAKPDNPIVKWLGIAAAIILGLAGVIQALKTLDDAYHLWTPKPQPIPTFPQYDSPRVGGGQTADTMCAGQRASYASAYPDFNIAIEAIPATTSKDLLGHVTYVFHCHFIATRKAG